MKAKLSAWVGKYLRTLARFPRNMFYGEERGQSFVIFTSPEGIDSLGGEDTPSAVQNPRVGLVQTALLDHFILNK